MLTAAIIGCGVIAPTHARALALDGRTVLRWACDTDIAKARARVPAERYTSDLAEVLADPGVDLVHICTPHAAHADQVVAALAAGKHVICEKPLATTPDDIARMLAAARVAAGRARPLICSGIYQHRFVPLAARLRQLLRGGDFGVVTTARMEFRCTRTADYYASSPWRGTWAGEGGALLINQAIHTIDQLTWLAGDPVAVAATVARTRINARIECEDTARLRVRLASGTIAEVACDNDQVTDWHARIRIEAERGAVTLGDGGALIELEHPSAVLRSELSALDGIRSESVRLPGKSEYGDHHALQIADCIGAILAGRPPAVTIADAAPSIRTVLAAYHSAALGGTEVALGAAGYRHPVITASAASSAQGTP